MLRIEHLRVIQGEQQTWSWTWFQTDPSSLQDWAAMTYRNFTGASGQMRIRAAPEVGSVSYLNLPLSFTSAQVQGGPPVPAFPNAFGTTITAAQVNALPVGLIWFDCIITDVTGVPLEYLAGTFTVSNP